MKIDLNYDVASLIDFLLDADKMSLDELASKLNLSRVVLYKIIEENECIDSVLETIYAYAFHQGYRLNSVKEEFSKEASKHKILFHGSKYGLTEINPTGSRNNCDFGNGFYLGESYSQALAFVCDKEKSSVYSFEYTEKDLKVLRLDCSMEWMLAICYFRGTIKEFEQSPKVQNIVHQINDADLIVAPIADNRMFFIMSSFANGDINSEVALHSLSASRLGMQYVFKTEKALQCLKPIERFYISQPESKECVVTMDRRAEEIDTKLKLAKREFRTGLYVEELLK